MRFQCVYMVSMATCMLKLFTQIYCTGKYICLHNTVNFVLLLGGIVLALYTHAKTTNEILNIKNVLLSFK